MILFLLFINLNFTGKQLYQDQYCNNKFLWDFQQNLTFFRHSPIIYFYISERGAVIENVGRWGGTARHLPFRRLNQSIHQKLHQGTRCLINLVFSEIPNKNFILYTTSYSCLFATKKKYFLILNFKLKKKYDPPYITTHLALWRVKIEDFSA